MKGEKVTYLEIGGDIKTPQDAQLWDAATEYF